MNVTDQVIINADSYTFYSEVEVNAIFQIIDVRRFGKVLVAPVVLNGFDLSESFIAFTDDLTLV